MLRAIEIENFRTFRHLKIGGFARFNLIAGENNAGKTALLEALHLAGFAGNCSVPLAMNGLRGLAQSKQDPFSAGRTLFHDLDNSCAIRIVTEDTGGAEQSVTVKLVDAQTATTKNYAAASKQFATHFPAELWNGTSPRMIMEYSDSHGSSETAVGVMKDAGTILFAGHTAGYPTIFVSVVNEAGTGELNHYVDDQNELFSELEAAKRQDEVLGVLRKLEPRLQKLLLLFFGEPMIYAELGLPRPLPVGLLGEGFRRLLYFLLLIAMRHHAILLIDEIENGLHYSVVKDVWKAIAQAARVADVQVFATTHSYECIQAAHEAFVEDGTYDFALHRLDREDGGIEAVSYDQETLETGLELFHEMR